MCVVSMVGDHYNDKWSKDWYNKNPWWEDTKITTYPTSEQFEALKKEVEEMKKLLLRAKKYDEDNNEPHCEMEDKVDLLKKVAKAVGVDLSEVFGDGNPTKSL